MRRWPKPGVTMKLLPLLAGALALAATLAHAATPMRASAFTDSIGVGTHLTRQSAYYDAKKVQAALRYLGVRHLRDAAPDPRAAYPAVFGAYAELGYDFTLTGSGYSTAAQAERQAAAFQAAHPGAIAALEGYNEPNNWQRPPQGWYAGGSDTHVGAQAYTRELVTHGFELPGVAILDASDEPPPACAGSAVNVHSYAKYSKSQANPQIGYPQPTLWYDLGRYRRACLSQLTWVTETGYYTSAGVDGVSEPVQAQYLLQSLAYDAQQGVLRTYLYELLDQSTGSPNSEMNYGLFHTDGKPKPVATQLRSLLAALSDKGSDAASFMPKPLRVTFDDPAVKSLLLAKSDGSYVMLFWKEQNLWDGKMGRAVTPASTTFSFTFDAPRVVTYLRLQDGTAERLSRQAKCVWRYNSGVVGISISAD